MFMRCRDERGIAMVTALLVSMVLLFLTVAVVALSLHNSTQSALDRKRVQAIDAAEAGINGYMSSLTGMPDSTACQTIDQDLQTPAHYQVKIQLYSDWPPVTPITCPGAPGQPLPAEPRGAVVVSKGTAVSTGNPTAVSRTMETEIRLVPIYGGYGQAIFSDTGLNFQNQLTENGNQGNDGDVYTNGNFDLGNNTAIGGSVYAQGYASIGQGVVKANVWANQYVSLFSGVQVYGNATSSTSSITLGNPGNAHVYGNAKAGTSISVSNSSKIDGTKTPNSPSGPPPKVDLPQITYDQCAWTCQPPDGLGFTEKDFLTCSSAQSFIDTIPPGDFVVRISPTCATGLRWTGSNNTIRGNLAIFVDGGLGGVSGTPGAIRFTNQNTWTSSGGTWTVWFIIPYRGGLNCTKPSPYDMSFSQNTSFNGLNAFIYSQCNIDFANNNASGFNGQIIGGNVNITNQMTMNFVPIKVPGNNLIGYNAQPSYLREVKNS